MAATRYKDYVRRWREPWHARRVRAGALKINSDGCSFVPDFYLIVCYEHDLHYAYHRDYYTFKEITKEDADRYLRWGIQFHSWFGRWSPMAWWRYWALSNKKGLGLGQNAWDTGPARAKQRITRGYS